MTNEGLQDFINEKVGEPITDGRAFAKKMAADFRWNRYLILEAATTALEGANAHEEAACARCGQKKRECGSLGPRMAIRLCR